MRQKWHALGVDSQNFIPEYNSGHHVFVILLMQAKTKEANTYV